MNDHDTQLIPTDRLNQLLSRTPARAVVGRAGSAYLTPTALQLREDHAAARDAVQSEIVLERDFSEKTLNQYQLFATQTCVTSKSEYLRRPDLGRKLSEDSRALISKNCSAECDIQVVIGDGLSALAVIKQATGLLERLHQKAAERGWSFGRPFFVHYCRVGVMNDVGDLLRPSVVILLIGERPGLATAESLSAYMAYRPASGHTDAQRNLISNIHARGVSLDHAAERIMALAERFRQLQMSGVGVSERNAIQDNNETIKIT